MTETFVYKDVILPKRLQGVINCMADVESCREELGKLGSQWDLLTILGQMGGTRTDMTGTRMGFQGLTAELLSQLGLESLKKTVQDISAKAQVVVDIVIRNLFERTADIGFLATDDDIRDFLNEIKMYKAEDEGAGHDRRRLTAAMVKRFREYVAKYSVYFDIVLMDPEGHVAARLDDKQPLEQSKDPLIREALATRGEYVEIFRETDLLPNAGDSLVYAYRVTQNNDPSSRPLGVLALCFRFQNEMDGVFRNLKSEDDWAVMTLLNKDGEVIASSDEYHVPIGAKMELALDAEYRVVRFAGREYLAKTCKTTGYEGFFGLGWLGHVMLPLDHAFDQSGDSDLKQRVEETILEAVMSDPQLFSQELRGIPIQADQIQSELERTVWNGNVCESDASSKVLLWNISRAGSRTKAVFEESIGNLHETVVSAILGDVEFQAALGVDIMDRNLYERANDCRWWALTSAFRRLLAQETVSAGDRRKITDILQYINGLYTVYTNLFVYNAKGEILAVSNPAEEEIVGAIINERWVSQTLALRDSQRYSVSPFEKSNLYNGRHTYIYGASITDVRDSSRVLGGIGIVFDSEPQFEAMLKDSLPRNNKDEVSEGCFGIFADRNQTIISSTDPAHPVGEKLNIGAEFFSLPNGEKTSRIIEYRGQYYAVGACTSFGYREYKVSDSYRNDIIGLVFAPLAKVQEQKAPIGLRREFGMDIGRARTGGLDCVEMATFYIGAKWLGVNAQCVVEAVNFKGVSAIPGAHPIVRGKMLYNNHVIPVLLIHSELRAAKPADESRSSVIVVQYTDENDKKQLIGIVVDSLGEIPEIDKSRIVESPSLFDRKGLARSVVKPDPGSECSEMFVELNLERLIDCLTDDIQDELAAEFKQLNAQFQA
ncbi:Chemotaxis signal transduction protein [Desulfatibacillum alkenivorans DSM 16219]|uniref:Chemotaxis signal transduction protein n=1 Tax=Desulfatibacillum alkenivorans DSM 16219 TaxID=1121393 RepID=A0A1M6QKH2_9BACT|nr:chemotaxis protein CheW [Desulfatibacillum alkenivorans]SHK20789.1 Chemotaxis signal transduction protein [Desulfatibacillum alkenivorans DSM 16219]